MSASTFTFVIRNLWRPRLRAALAAWVGSFALLTVATTGPKAVGSPLEVLPYSYWSAVDLAKSGDLQEALRRFGAIPGGDKDAEVQRLVKLGQAVERCGICQARIELSNTPVAQAALLHAEAAWQAPQLSLQRREELRRARDLFDAVRVLPSGRVLALDWYRVAALVAHERMDWDLGEWLADQGLQRYPDDGHLLLTKGTLLEVVGWRGRGRHDASGRACLERSRTALERAMGSVDVSRSFEARLRLAHVTWLLGQRRTAEEMLESLDSSAPDVHWKYLVALFLGGVLADEGALTRAEAAYRRALELEPDSQAAHVALAHVTFLQGEVREARTILDQVLAPRPTRATDPFWLYPWGRTGDASRQAGLLRQRATECCR